MNKLNIKQSQVLTIITYICAYAGLNSKIIGNELVKKKVDGTQSVDSPQSRL
jgi:hypothetical protein